MNNKPEEPAKTIVLSSLLSSLFATASIFSFVIGIQGSQIENLLILSTMLQLCGIFVLSGTVLPLVDKSRSGEPKKTDLIPRPVQTAIITLASISLIDTFLQMLPQDLASEPRTILLKAIVILTMTAPAYLIARFREPHTLSNSPEATDATNH